MRNLLSLALLVCLVCTVTVSSAEDRVAFLIIDVQKCFLPGGTLQVGSGDVIIPVINSIRKNYGKQFALTVLTQDWHCADHVSFASHHSGNKVYDQITLQYDAQNNLCEGVCVAAHNVSQTLWPDHCVINTTDANLATQLDTSSNDVIVRKGYHCDVDSYSAFYDNGGFSQTELNAKLQKEGITKVLVAGLALDYCVYYTAKDAVKLGYEVYFILDATRPVSEDNVENILTDLRSKGVHVINSNELDAAISGSNTMANVSSILLLIFSCIWRVL